MPDTIRTLAGLDQQFADNIEGAIAPQDIRDLVVSLMVHGEIGSVAKPAITLGTGFQAMDFNTAGIIGRGLVIDTTNKVINGFPVSLKADVKLEVLFRGTNNTTYEFAVFKNPATNPVQLTALDASVRIFNAAMVGVVSVSVGVQLEPGDTLQAGVRANGASFELLRGLLKVRRIGVE